MIKLAENIVQTIGVVRACQKSGDDVRTFIAEHERGTKKHSVHTLSDGTVIWVITNYEATTALLPDEY